MAADGDLTRMVYIVSANARHRTDGVYAKDINVILNRSELMNSSMHKSSTRNDLPHMGIAGIALIRPGKVCNGLVTGWDPEEALLWSIFGYPSDAASIEVVEVARCTGFAKAQPHLASFSASSRQQLTRLAPRVAATVLASEVSLRGTTTTCSGSEMANIWSVEMPMSSPCMILPTQICSAICNGTFSRIMLCSRQMRRQY